MKTCISLGKIGNTDNANNENPIIIIGRYQIRLEKPKTIGDAIISPRNAFLESVRVIKVTNKKQIISIISFLLRFFLGLQSSAKQKGQTSTIHNPA